MLNLGIDIGTTSTKVIIVDDQLNIVSSGAREYGLCILGNGGVEQDPLDWWRACCEILQQFWREGVDSQRIQGVAVSGHGVSLVVLDENGTILRPAISSLDTRCLAQTHTIRQRAEAQVLTQNGNRIGAFNFEPKLLWLKDTEPSHYEKMPNFLSATGFINYMLTGRRVLNVSDGGMALAYDRKSGGQWSDSIIAAMQLDPEKYPTLLPCAAVIGGVREQAAKETGLPEGIPVIAGGEDTSSAALSAGIVAPNTAYISLGTQGTVGVCTDQYAVQPEILGFPHVLPNLTLLSGSMSSFGLGLQWFVREWCRDIISDSAEMGSNPYEVLMERCSQVKPGAAGLVYLPYLSGELHPILDESAKGVFFGLSLEHTREYMAVAIMEGSAHAIRHNLYYAEQVSGHVNVLHAVGGPTKNVMWCQAIADITGKTVKVMGVDCGAPMGNVMLLLNALKGQDVDEIVLRSNTVQRVYTPRAEYQSLYDKKHQVYIALYEKLKDLFPKLST